VTTNPSADALRQVGALFDGATFTGLSDGELLERFTGRAGAAAEAAFAELVRRHGSMVLSMCRARMRDEHEADDAFQATFLVLVKKARALSVRDSLGPWLHGVTLRVTRCSLRTVARRQFHERRAAETGSRMRSDAPPDERAVIHEEVGRLPERYRAVIVLCDLEGLTHEAAARQLRCPVGTIKSRQARARERLRESLIRRGLTPTLVVLAADAARAAVPGGLAEATVTAALRVGAGNAATAGVVSTSIAILAQRGLRTMLLSQSRLAAGSILAAAVLTAGLAIVAQEAAPSGGAAQVKKKTEPESTQTPQEEFEALLGEFNTMFAANGKWGQEAKTPEERQASSQRFIADLQRMNGRFLDLATKHPRTNAAEQALVWLAQNGAFSPEKAEALERLARDHARSDRIGALFGPRLGASWHLRGTEELLRRALDQNLTRKSAVGPATGWPTCSSIRPNAFGCFSSTHLLKSRTNDRSFGSAEKIWIGC
jgi:RNA polymerase sigma factor (sigma-70 family)